MSSIKFPKGFDPKIYKIDENIIIKNASTSKSNTKISKSKLLDEFNNFQKIDFTNMEHKNELLKMFPDWLLVGAHDTDNELFLAMSRFDKKNKTFIAGCFNSSFNLISYKYRQVSWMPGKKWITRKGTSPNTTLFPRIYSDDGTIYFIEGHKDALTAVLLTIDFVMIPYAGYINRDITSISKEIKDRNIVFIVEDKSAYICMMRLAKLLQDSARHIELKQLSKNMKMDLSDYVQKFNSIKEVIYELQN